MKKIIAVIICFCLVISLTGCCCINNRFERKNDEIINDNANIKYGSYIKSDTYIASTGQSIYNEYTQAEYLYLKDGELLWYLKSGSLWVCRNYSFTIDGNDICCTPKYDNGLVDIVFKYDEDKNEISIELNDIVLIYSYIFEDIPVENVYQNV